MRKSFKAFTLVEMLVVMGIIIILMAIGIASGRFAIQRANKIEHQNAAEQIYQGMQSYYADNREYPGKGDVITPRELLTGDLQPYIDDFDGGSEATYAYAVNDTGQEMIVCVTYGGVGDQNEVGIYCTGNGINGSMSGPTVREIEYDAANATEYNAARAIFTDGTDNYCSDWQPGTGWLTTCVVPTAITVSP